MKANNHKVMHITIIYVQERPCLYCSDYVQQISYHGVEEFRGDISLFLAHYHKEEYRSDLSTESRVQRVLNRDHDPRVSPHSPES